MNTTTLGVREARLVRHTLRRTVTTLETPYGVVHRKNSEGWGVLRRKYEFEDLARIARAENISLTEAAERVESAGRGE